MARKAKGDESKAAATVGPVKGEFPRVETHVIGTDTRQRTVRADECAELETVGVSMAGVSEASPDFRFARVWPSFAQILLTLEGSGEVMVGERWVVVKKGQAYLTPPRVAHAYRALSGGQPWTVAWCHYREYATAFSRPRVAPGEFTLPRAILGLIDEVEGAALPAAKLCWARLIDISARRILGPDARDQRTSGVWATVAADLARNWTLEDLAGLAGLSTEQFRRKCQATLGRAPMHHLAQLRMQHAAELLSSTELKSEEIARRVGYENMFTFSVAFKREMGMPPTSYRK